MLVTAKTWFESDPRNRPRPHTFRPPKDNRFVCWLSKHMAAHSVRNKLKVVETTIDDRDLDALKSLRGKRCLVMPSHSGGFEPYVILDLLRKIDTNCYYMAAMEALISSKVRTPISAAGSGAGSEGGVNGEISVTTFISSPSSSKVRKNSSLSGPFSSAIIVPRLDSAWPAAGS